uniref:Methyltransferase-like protein 13 n=1 Tax=Kalanchoe fedtschenkoi TaxID=63787 RepID=A0A7N0RHI6_KALFE
MAMDLSKFETLTPSLFTTFTIPNPISSTAAPLRIAVLDSPAPPPSHPPQIAAMIVPSRRERDWNFSTESGQLQLLYNSPGISRLVLVGNVPESADDSTVIYNRCSENDCVISEEDLIPLLVALSPKASFVNGYVDVPFLSYEDDLIASVVLEKCVGPFVGEMLVEDVEIEIKTDAEVNSGEGFKKREFRRRLRFRRMPNFVQTEIRIVPGREVGQEEHLGVCNFEFHVDLEALVHPYLGPMAASLKLISDCIEEKMRVGVRPRALCVGVGGGALLGFLKMQLDFIVVGIEVDEEVLRVSKDYFGMVEDEHLQLCVRDGMQELKRYGCTDEHSFGVHDAGGGVCCNGLGCKPKFDVIMVDLDSEDPMHGLMAPPVPFVQRSVLKDVKLALQKTGILVVNVIPPDDCYYKSLTNDFREIFADLYEIDVGNEENFVLIASASPVEPVSNNNNSYIVKKLKHPSLSQYAERIKKI